MKHNERQCCVSGCDRVEVSKLCCGRNNPGSNPGHGILAIEIV